MERDDIRFAGSRADPPVSRFARRTPMNTADYEFFRRNGYIALGQLFSGQDAARLRQGFDEDRATWGRAFWRPLESAYQTVNRSTSAVKPCTL